MLYSLREECAATFDLSPSPPTRVGWGWWWGWVSLVGACVSSCVYICVSSWTCHYIVPSDALHSFPQAPSIPRLLGDLCGQDQRILAGGGIVGYWVTWLTHVKVGWGSATAKENNTPGEHTWPGEPDRAEASWQRRHWRKLMRWCFLSLLFFLYTATGVITHINEEYSIHN